MAVVQHFFFLTYCALSTPEYRERVRLWDEANR